MTNRKRRRRLVIVGLLAFVLGTTGFAYAASLTFNGGTDAGRAGSGTGTISGPPPSYCSPPHRQTANESRKQTPSRMSRCRCPN